MKLIYEQVEKQLMLRYLMIGKSKTERKTMEIIFVWITHYLPS